MSSGAVTGSVQVKCSATTTPQPDAQGPSSGLFAQHELLKLLGDTLCTTNESRLKEKSLGLTNLELYQILRYAARYAARYASD